MRAALLLLALAFAGVHAHTFPQDQSHVIIGDAAAAHALREFPTLQLTLLETGADQKRMSAHDRHMAEDAALLMNAELLAQQLGAKTVSSEHYAKLEEEMKHVEREVNHEPVRRQVDPVDRLLAEVDAEVDHDIKHTVDSEMEHEQEHESELELHTQLLGLHTDGHDLLDDTDLSSLSSSSYSFIDTAHSAAAAASPVDLSLPTQLLETAPAAAALPTINGNEADMEDELMAKELEMLEISTSLSADEPTNKNHNYLYIDDPKNGGATPASLKNLRGLDIFVVNTPVNEAENEIRPVPPPRPRSKKLRARLAREAAVRKSLVHDVPRPKALVKPKTPINTLSAYEPALHETRPLIPQGKQKAADKILSRPIAGMQGALPPSALSGKRSFITTGTRVLNTPPHQQPQRPRARNTLPGFPLRDPAAANAPGPNSSSFDLNDGPPVELNELLPHRAELVETLTPDIPQPAKPNW